TRHGPVVRRDADKAYALRWTATEPGGLANTYNWMGKARNWEEFRNVMKRVWGPAQNAVYADVDGNIGYVMAARVPIRKKGHGETPVPGDTDDYEWTGYLPFDQLPQALNPDSGLIVTANAPVVGTNYKPYLTDRWEEPYRTARIYDLLLDKGGLRPEDMLKVQTDTYSYPHAFLADQLSAAAKTPPPKHAPPQNRPAKRRAHQKTHRRSKGLERHSRRRLPGSLIPGGKPPHRDCPPPRTISWQRHTPVFLEKHGILAENPNGTPREVAANRIQNLRSFPDRRGRPRRG